MNRPPFQHSWERGICASLCSWLSWLKRCLLLCRGCEVCGVLRKLHSLLLCLLSSWDPLPVLTFVTEVLLRVLKLYSGTKIPRDRTTWPVVVLYMHNVSHGLKKIAYKAKGNVVFSAPHRLYILCKKSKHLFICTFSWTKRHRSNFVTCVEGWSIHLAFLVEKSTLKRLDCV